MTLALSRAKRRMLSGFGSNRTKRPSFSSKGQRAQGPQDQTTPSLPWLTDSRPLWSRDRVDLPADHRAEVHCASDQEQKRGVFGIIKRELRRRSAIEPVIGNLKTEGPLGRCHLKGREGDPANVILTAVGQSPPRARLAEVSAVSNPARSMAAIRHRAGSQMGFLTADYILRHSRSGLVRYLNSATSLRTPARTIANFFSTPNRSGKRSGDIQSNNV